MVSTVDEMMRAFNRDSLRRAGFHRTDGFYLTPAQAQEIMPIDLDVAETVRHGTIGLCEVCGEDFDKRRGNQVLCSDECRKERRRSKSQEYENRPERLARRAERLGENLRVKTANETVADPANATGDAWVNLLLGVMYQAHLDEDAEAVADLHETYLEMRRGSDG